MFWFLWFFQICLNALYCISLWIPFPEVSIFLLCLDCYALFYLLETVWHFILLNFYFKIIQILACNLFSSQVMKTARISLLFLPRLRESHLLGFHIPSETLLNSVDKMLSGIWGPLWKLKYRNGRGPNKCAVFCTLILSFCVSAVLYETQLMVRKLQTNNRNKRDPSAMTQIRVSVAMLFWTSYLMK